MGGQVTCRCHPLRPVSHAWVVQEERSAKDPEWAIPLAAVASGVDGFVLSWRGGHLEGGAQTRQVHAR